MNDQSANSRKYLETQIKTASREKLLLLLYEGAINFCETAKKAISEEDRETTHTFLVKAQRIVAELICSLKVEHNEEVAKNLASLYGFVYSQLVNANVKRDVESIDNALQILRTLYEAWKEAINRVDEKVPDDGTTTQPAEPAEKPTQPSLSISA